LHRKLSEESLLKGYALPLANAIISLSRLGGLHHRYTLAA
jgi:hypothetical protein